jgi:hypothetical protein
VPTTTGCAQYSLHACSCSPADAHDAQATNSFNQNPCLVAAILVAAPTCYDDEYNIPTLPGDNYYSNAGLQVPCVCNDAVYSLFAACADCQGHIFVNFTSWTDGCNSTFQTYQGTVPPTTTIPPWATLNVEVRTHV